MGPKTLALTSTKPKQPSIATYIEAIINNQCFSVTATAQTIAEKHALKTDMYHDANFVVPGGTIAQIARFMEPTWGPLGADRTHVGPVLAP